MLRTRAILLGAAAAMLAMGASVGAHAGGPRWTRGAVYGNWAGLPVGWFLGYVTYYTDQGPLSATVDNAAANAMVAAAFAPWGQVIDATVSITHGGSLAEDVNGSNTYAGANGVVLPADVQSGALKFPVAVVYDADGSVTDAMLGQGASDPEGCWLNAVTERVDNLDSNGNITHALLVLNGRCTGGAEDLLQMQYQLERMFGRVLGLDWSQLNDNVFTGTPAPTLAEEQNWPLMHPIDVRCGPYTYQCVVNPFALRIDDRAALARTYSVNPNNVSLFRGKKSVYDASIDDWGQFLFPDGQPMQGMNMVVSYVSPSYGRLWSGELMSSVTGYGFRGDAGNPVTGYLGPDGQRLDKFGSAKPSDEGFFSTLGLEQTLEPGRTVEALQFSIEPINPLYTGDFSVGPYTMDTVSPSGTFAPYVQAGLADSSQWDLTETMSGSAGDNHFGLDGTEAAPGNVPATGFWTEQLATYGHTGWYGLKVRANRSFTVETVALDELGYATVHKAMPVIGIWNGGDALGSAPDANSPQAFNGAVDAGTTVAASVAAAETVRIAVADERGDGRPDFTYRARVLYADSISPAAIGVNGGIATITGMGFRAGNSVTINGIPASVTSATANQIAVAAPSMKAAGGALGSPMDVTVSDPATGGSTTMSGALAYGNAPTVTDQLIVVSGGGQVVPATATLAQVAMEVTDGKGNPVPNALVQVYQTVTSYQQCQKHGRCAAPALLGVANTAERSDANGMISVDPLQIADRPQMVNMVATAESQGLVRLLLAKHP